MLEYGDRAFLGTYVLVTWSCGGCYLKGAVWVLSLFNCDDAHGAELANFYSDAVFLDLFEQSFRHFPDAELLVTDLPALSAGNVGTTIL